VIGVCGGFQMLGQRIDDPDGVESPKPSVPGLGLLDAVTLFEPTKARHLVSGRTVDRELPLVGYEIHMGRTRLGDSARPFARLVRGRDGSTVLDGAVSPCGRFAGTYLHGLFDSRPFTAWLIDHLRSCRGLAPLDPARADAHRDALAGRYAGLAQLLRESLDLTPILAALDRR
jgi:adenosylcobyric acid synthase